MHYTTLSEYDGKFWSGGLIFGAGPDLHIDLDNPTRCITQLGSTYELPKACAISGKFHAHCKARQVTGLPLGLLVAGVWQRRALHSWPVRHLSKRSILLSTRW